MVFPAFFLWVEKYEKEVKQEKQFNNVYLDPQSNDLKFYKLVHHTLPFSEYLKQSQWETIKIRTVTNQRQQFRKCM